MSHECPWVWPARLTSVHWREPAHRFGTSGCALRRSITGSMCRAGTAYGAHPWKGWIRRHCTLRLSGCGKSPTSTRAGTRTCCAPSSASIRSTPMISRRRRIACVRSGSGSTATHRMAAAASKPLPRWARSTSVCTRLRRNCCVRLGTVLHRSRRFRGPRRDQRTPASAGRFAALHHRRSHRQPGRAHGRLRTHRDAAGAAWTAITDAARGTALQHRLHGRRSPEANQ